MSNFIKRPAHGTLRELFLKREVIEKDASRKIFLKASLPKKCYLIYFALIILYLFWLRPAVCCGDVRDGWGTEEGLLGK